MRLFFIVLSAIGLLSAGCQSQKSHPLVVFAAASTQEPLREIATRFETETGISVEFSFEASSTLARQIEQGAHADFFLSADEDWADYLQERNLVENRRDLLTNRLVLIVPTESKLVIKEIRDLSSPDLSRLAVAGESVPAGRYARQALRHGSVWDGVQDRLLNGANVRATLAYVATGEANAGFVYATDVIGSSKVRVAWMVPDDFHQPICYPLVRVRQDQPRAGKDRFYEFLVSEASQEVFRKAGFGVVKQE